MTINATAADNSIDAPAAEALPTIFGVDGAGAAHHHDQWNDRVAVIEADGTVHHHDLDNEAVADREDLTQLDAWVQHVAAERGWADEWHDETITGADESRRVAAARTEAMA